MLFVKKWNKVSELESCELNPYMGQSGFLVFKAQINLSVRMRAFLTLVEGAILVREWVKGKVLRGRGLLFPVFDRFIHKQTLWCVCVFL